MWESFFNISPGHFYDQFKYLVLASCLMSILCNLIWLRWVSSTHQRVNLLCFVSLKWGVQVSNVKCIISDVLGKTYFFLLWISIMTLEYFFFFSNFSFPLKGVSWINPLCGWVSGSLGSFGELSPSGSFPVPWLWYQVLMWVYSNGLDITSGVTECHLMWSVLMSCFFSLFLVCFFFFFF